MLHSLIQKIQEQGTIYFMKLVLLAKPNKDKTKPQTPDLQTNVYQECRHENLHRNVLYQQAKRRKALYQ